MKRSGMPLILLALMVAMTSPAAHAAAEFLEYYKLGLSSEEAQQWTQAADRMRQAIALQPIPRTKVKKALFFKRYLPHFHLGKALFESGDCAAARAAWNVSESHGVVQRFPEYQQLQDGREACHQMADLEVALGRALQAVKQAEATASLSRRRLAGLPISDAAVNRLLQRQTEAEANLGRVSSRLKAGDVALREVEEAARVAAESRREFVALEQLAKDQRTLQMQQIRDNLNARVEPLIVAAGEQLAASEYLRPYPTAVARGRAKVEQALEHALALEDGSLSRGEVEALITELETSTEALQQATLPPPAALTAAAAAYLDRDYSGVLIALADREFESKRAIAHSHLLKAAALYSLYHVTGASDSELLDRARDEVLACQRADERQIPPIAVFSPGFLAFFQEQAQVQVSVDEPGPDPESSESGV